MTTQHDFDKEKPMKIHRRRLFQQTTLGAGTMAAGLLSGTVPGSESKADLSRTVKEKHRQRFNMCGFSAPRMERVRVGFVGIGSRGTANLMEISRVDGAEIRALCDKRMFRIDEARKKLAERGLPEAKVYGGSEDAWKEMCQSPDLDLIHIAVPRGPLHTRIAVHAMENGKHAAVEVPAAATLDEAWQLVETSERTKKHCMMLENCCYDFFELLTLQMVRQGFFGEIIHADAGYIHHQDNFKKTGDGDMWRLRESQHRNGNLYPTHGLGPVCQAMNINRGDRLTLLTSMSSDDFQMGKTAAELARKDPAYREFDTHSYRGNMNTTLLRSERGRTIMLQYDITSPRIYSRIHMISGTRGMAQKYPLPERIARDGEWFSEEKMKALWEEYSPPILRRIGEMARKVGGHGGMDLLMNWRLIDCLRNGLPLDQDVYDAALWSSITPLSEWSVANGSKPVEIPDFTCGSYRTNVPVDLSPA